MKLLFSFLMLYEMAKMKRKENSKEQTSASRWGFKTDVDGQPSCQSWIDDGPW